jgi:hypothetical protein
MNVMKGKFKIFNTRFFQIGAQMAKKVQQDYFLLNNEEISAEWH